MLYFSTLLVKCLVLFLLPSINLILQAYVSLTPNLPLPAPLDLHPSSCRNPPPFLLLSPVPT